MSLTGKKALITGAGRGIGRGCALALANAGAELVINDRPGCDDLLKTKRDIEALGAKCHVVEADVFDYSAREHLVSASIARADTIDILVNVPAVNLRCSFLELKVADFERVLSSTLTSAFHMSQLAARNMVKTGRGGKIIFISSLHGELPVANNIAYGASKAGLNQMARTISVELAPHRINVNSIEPGWIDTPGERAVFSDSVIESEGRLLPWGRMGKPEDIAHFVVFLASSAADYVTGATIPVDGGYRFKDGGSGTLTKVSKSC